MSSDYELDARPVDDIELEQRFGLSREELAKREAVYARGDIPEEPLHIKTPGRPSKYGERLQFVGFRELQATIDRMDLRATSLGLSRSGYLRHLVEEDLKAAGA